MAKIVGRLKVVLKRPLAAGHTSDAVTGIEFESFQRHADEVFKVT